MKARLAILRVVVAALALLNFVAAATETVKMAGFVKVPSFDRMQFWEPKQYCKGRFTGKYAYIFAYDHVPNARERLLVTRTYKLLAERLSREQVGAAIDFIVLLPIGLDKPVAFPGTRITVMVMPYPVDPSQLSKTLQQMFARRTELGKCCGWTDLFKLNIFRLTQYSRVMLINPELTIRRRNDFLFKCPVDVLYTSSPTGPLQDVFLVVKPSKTLYADLVSRLTAKDAWSNSAGWWETGYPCRSVNEGRISHSFRAKNIKGGNCPGQWLEEGYYGMSGFLYAFFLLLGKTYKAEALDPCIYNYNWGHACTGRTLGLATHLNKYTMRYNYSCAVPRPGCEAVPMLQYNPLKGHERRKETLPCRPSVFVIGAPLTGGPDVLRFLQRHPLFLKNPKRGGSALSALQPYAWLRANMSRGHDAGAYPNGPAAWPWWSSDLPGTLPPALWRQLSANISQTPHLAAYVPLYMPGSMAIGRPEFNGTLLDLFQLNTTQLGVLGMNVSAWWGPERDAQLADRSVMHFINQHYSETEGNKSYRVGDASDYLPFRAAPKRMVQLCPKSSAEFKFIVMMRNPVERIEAAYSAGLYAKLGSKSFNNDTYTPIDQWVNYVITSTIEAIYTLNTFAMNEHFFSSGKKLPYADKSLSRNIVLDSMYMYHLEQWFKYFEHSQFYFLCPDNLWTFDERVRNETVASLLDWIGLDYDPRVLPSQSDVAAQQRREVRLRRTRFDIKSPTYNKLVSFLSMYNKEPARSLPFTCGWSWEDMTPRYPKPLTAWSRYVPQGIRGWLGSDSRGADPAALRMGQEQVDALWQAQPFR